MRSSRTARWSFVFFLPVILCAVTAAADTTISAGTISTTTTWTLANSPYVVNGSVRVDGGTNPLLTIEPGVTVKFAAGGELVVNYYGNGAVRAVGTASAPITFTSNGGTVPGSWPAIFLSNSGATASELAYAVVEYGGSTSMGRGGIHVQNGAHTFDHVTFRKNLVAGLSIENGAPSVTNCTFEENSGYGINVTGGAPTIAAGTFTSNTDYAIGSPASVQLGGMTGHVATGNGSGAKDAILVRGGVINANRRWYASGLPYVVTGSVRVDGGSNPALTVDPGVTVKFAAGADMVVNYYGNGSLQAVGTAEAPIVFTANGSTAPGFWLSIYLGGSGATDSRLEYATVEYGGVANNSRGGVHIDGRAHVLQNVTLRNNLSSGLTIVNGTPQLSNCTIANNGTFGINVTGGSPTINNSTLTGNADYAIAANASLQLTGMTGLTATGNGADAKNAILLRGGVINANRRWYVSALPYVVSGSIRVDGGADPVLTIDPGQVVKFTAGSDLVVNYYGPGSLQAVGTAALPILFTANGSTAPGYWLAILLGGAGTTNSRLEYATVEYAGVANNARGGVHVDGRSHVLQNVTLRNNLSSGLTVVNGTPVIADCTIANNGSYGINVTAGAPAITNVTFTGNADYAIGAEAHIQLNGMSGLTATGNGAGAKDAVLLRGATISASRTWYVSALPYVISGSVRVDGGSNPTLTIQPGVVVKFKSRADMVVNYYGAGSINAAGTAAAPILFTAENSTARGFWIAILLGSAGASNSSFAYTTVEYSGSTSPTRGGIHVTGNSPTFDHVTFRENFYAGLGIEGGTPVISNCTITATTGQGMEVYNASPTVTSSTFTYNTGYAIALDVKSELLGLTDITVSNNGTGKDAIYLRAGTISTSKTWRTTPVPYVMDGTINVHGGASPVLTIQAGVTVRFGSRADMTVNYYGNGSIQVLGTPAQPVLLTSNGTQTPGYWLAILLGGSGGTESRFENAIVEYSGSNSPWRGAVHVEGRAPVFDNVTFRNNLVGGLTVGSGAPVVTNCTFSANSGAGIEVTGGSLSVASSAFTNNTAYAVRMVTNTDLLSATGLTATGQPAGRNSIWVNGGTLNASRTWPVSSLPYVISAPINVHGSSTPVLTIAAGNTVKFEPSAELVVNYYGPGGIQAVGTLAAPILFTTNKATPAPSSWLAIYLGGASQTRSDLAYATVEYGGYAPWNRGSVHVGGGVAVFDHVTFSNNAVAGMSISGGSSTIKECTFAGNPAGITSSGTFTADARRSYWSAANGPSGSGFGTGQSVGANVTFEPWLTAPPTWPQSFTSADVRNRTFNPSINTTSGLVFALASAADWTMTVADASNNVVRTMTGTGSPNDVPWDGRSGGGAVQPNGAYTYVVSTADAASISGRMIVDTNKRLTGTASADAAFSPNGDGVLDTATIRGTANFDDAAWTVTIKSSAGSTVRQSNATGLALTYVWDGRDAAGSVQPDGAYAVDVYRTAGTDTLNHALSTLIDITPPVAVIAAPVAGSTMSNVYRNGATDVPVDGTATDANLNDWRLDYGAGAAPTAWTVLGTGTTNVAAARLGLWSSLASANGTYTFRLQVTDKVGTRTIATATATLGNFTMSKNVDQFKPSASQTATYTSIVPFPLTETLTIRNEAGAVVRTLFDGARTAATQTDVWNGLNDAGAIVPDGPYRYVATVTDGTNTMTWDQSAEMRTDGWVHNYPTLSTDFDPFNNKPLAVTYTFNRPGRVYVIFSPYDHPTPCVAPAYCWKNQMWQESGTHTLYWAGIDDTFKLRPDLNRTTVTSWMSAWPKNAVFVYGSRPTISIVTVTPPFYGPAAGNQTVSFSFTTYQSQAATVETTFRNMSSGSVLRTITQTNQSPGTKTVTWDGRADNGMWVAPGQYVVTVRITDSSGNSTTGQILTNITY